MLTIKIHTGNAAYRDENGKLDSSNYELIRNLQTIIDQLESGYTEKSVFDINGNKTGEWKLTNR